MATKFQRLYPCFRVRATRLHYCGDCSTCGFVSNQRWRPVTGNIYDITQISASTHDCREIPTAVAMFSRSRYTTGLQKDCPTCGFVRNQWRWPVTWSRDDITHISACIHDSNGIPTAIPMFSGSGNKTRLLRKLIGVWICQESMMANIFRRRTVSSLVFPGCLTPKTWVK